MPPTTAATQQAAEHYLKMSRRGMLAYGHRDSISQDQWGKPWLVRSSTMPGGFATSAVAPAPSKSRGKRVLRSVVVFFSRSKRGKMTSKSAALTEPASPVSTAQLSRSSSATSSRQSGEEGGQAAERRVSSRARVSFNPEVKVSVATKVTFINNVLQQYVY